MYQTSIVYNTSHKLSVYSVDKQADTHDIYTLFPLAMESLSLSLSNSFTISTSTSAMSGLIRLSSGFSNEEQGDTLACSNIYANITVRIMMPYFIQGNVREPHLKPPKFEHIFELS